MLYLEFLTYHCWPSHQNRPQKCGHTDVSSNPPSSDTTDNCTWPQYHLPDSCSEICIVCSLIRSIFTVRKRCLGKVMYSQASVYPQGGLCLGTENLPEQRLPAGTETPRPEQRPTSRNRDAHTSNGGHCSERCASYWNTYFYSNPNIKGVPTSFEKLTLQVVFPRNTCQFISDKKSLLLFSKDFLIYQYEWGAC